MSRVDLVTLRLFIAVAEERSLGKAAQREHLASSAISKRLADLELNLNVRLFDRNPSGMSLTTAGVAMLNHARLIAHNVEDMETELMDFADGLRGTIRVQSNATAMASYLPHDLRSFFELYPQVRVSLIEGVSSETIRAVEDNIVDVGIYADVIPPHNLTTSIYRHDRLAVLVPEGHPLGGRTSVRFADTVDFNYIAAPAGSSIDTILFRAASAAGASLRANIRTSGFDVISNMVEAGLGIAVVPESVAALYEKSMQVRFLRLDEEWAERRLMVCTRESQALAPATIAFVDHLTRFDGSPAAVPRGRMFQILS